MSLPLFEIFIACHMRRIWSFVSSMLIFRDSKFQTVFSMLSVWMSKPVDMIMVYITNFRDRFRIWLLLSLMQLFLVLYYYFKSLVFFLCRSFVDCTNHFQGIGIYGRHGNQWSIRRVCMQIWYVFDFYLFYLFALKSQ